MIWYGWIQPPAAFKLQDGQWCGFRWSILLSIDYVWELIIDSVISTPSCSYCIWSRYCQNHRSILRDLLLFAWFDSIEFNRLPCSNNKMYDDIVFANRFRYQLTMFEVCVLIWLSPLQYTHIAFVIVIQKITTGNWHDAGNDLSGWTDIWRGVENGRNSSSQRNLRLIYTYIYITC